MWPQEPGVAGGKRLLKRHNKDRRRAQLRRGCGVSRREMTKAPPYGRYLSGSFSRARDEVSIGELEALWPASRTPPCLSCCGRSAQHAPWDNVGRSLFRNLDPAAFAGMDNPSAFASELLNFMGEIPFEGDKPLLPGWHRSHSEAHVVSQCRHTDFEVHAG